MFIQHDHLLINLLLYLYFYLYNCGLKNGIPRLLLLAGTLLRTTVLYICSA